MPEEEIDNIESPVEDESEKKCSVLVNIGEKIVFFSWNLDTLILSYLTKHSC